MSTFSEKNQQGWGWDHQNSSLVLLCHRIMHPVVVTSKTLSASCCHGTTRMEDVHKYWELPNCTIPIVLVVYILSLEGLGWIFRTRNTLEEKMQILYSHASRPKGAPPSLGQSLWVGLYRRSSRRSHSGMVN